MEKRRYSRRRSSFGGLSITLVGFAALTALILWLDDKGGTKLTGQARIVDGDSLLVNGHRLRLMGIDAPELGQECRLQEKPWRCGIAAKSALQKLLRGQEVECQTHGVDKYQRQLAICQSEGLELNAHMVETGWAIDFGGYAGEEGRARRNKVGLWRGQFEHPQEWRAANRSQSTAAPASLEDWWRQATSRLNKFVSRQ